jgi:carboxylesterase type B
MVCLTKLLTCILQPTAIGTARVNLSYNTYEGLQLSSGVNAFLGMRYAAPPLGDLRWRAPAEPVRTEVGTVERAITVSEPCFPHAEG